MEIDSYLANGFLQPWKAVGYITENSYLQGHFFTSSSCEGRTTIAHRNHADFHLGVLNHGRWHMSRFGAYTGEKEIAQRRRHDTRKD